MVGNVRAECGPAPSGASIGANAVDDGPLGLGLGGGIAREGARDDDGATECAISWRDGGEWDD
jgi:hypothetical protein